jgi:hypothetical protein
MPSRVLVVNPHLIPDRRQDRRELAGGGGAIRWGIWAAVTAAVLAIAVVWVVLTDMRPSYDAFGWLDWGRQTLHWDLNTDGAPSWKPLTFLFTLPYALTGPNPQVWLWMVTSTAAALAGSVFAARIAFRLTGPAPQRRYAPWIAGAFAGIGVLGLNGLSELVLIANSDPMVVTLCLATIDAHLCGRHRLAMVALVLAGFGRPEAWAFVVIYAGWMWREEPAGRLLWVASVLALPAAWFIVPGLTSHSWFSAGDLALGSANVIHGNKVIGVIDRLRGLYELPMQIAVLLAFGLALIRRERTWLGLAGAAVLWVAIEIAFAYHGWSAVPRYLIEPGAVFVVLAGAGVGWVLAYAPPWPGVVSRLGVVPVLALVVALAPSARARVRVTHGELHAARHAAREMTRLEAVIAADGGAAAIKACGQPVTLLGYQSEVAWATGLSVGNVGFRPGVSIRSGVPIVLLKPHDSGWQVRPYHTSQRCDRLRTDSVMGG